MLSRGWQRRPLDESSSLVVYHRRGSGPMVRACSPGRLPLSPHRGRGGAWTVSSTWLKYLGPGPGEGASFKGGSCAPVPAQQKRERRADRRGGTSRTGAKRGGNATGPAGLPEAIEATWPQATVQTCVVHPVPCLWMRFVSYGDRKKVAAALKADLHRSAPGGRLAGSD